MQTPVRISVYSLIGSEYCISIDDGQIIHDKVFPLLQNGRKVILSFQHISTLISSFLNSAVGRLYGELPEATIRALLDFDDIDPADRELVERVVENAKSYFANAGRHDEAWASEIGEEDGETEE